MKIRKILDALVVLTLSAALILFYLIFKVMEFRGNGGNDENKNLRGFSFTPISPDEMSPPTEPPLFLWCVWKDGMFEKKEIY